jgi:hypothetical protein
MEVTKIGESFTVRNVTDTYIIGGDITKTVSGDALFTINVSDLEEVFITSMRGDYRISDGRVTFDFSTEITRWSEQLEVITTVIDTVKDILKA